MMKSIMIGIALALLCLQCTTFATDEGGSLLGTCKEDYDCFTHHAAICVNGKCICGPGYVENGVFCDQVFYHGNFCNSDAECQRSNPDLICVRNSLQSVYKKCSCKPEYQWQSETNTCVSKDAGNDSGKLSPAKSSFAWILLCYVIATKMLSPLETKCMI